MPEKLWARRGPAVALHRVAPLLLQMPSNPTPHPPHPGSFLSNLDARITEDDIIELFQSSVGGVVAAAVHFNQR